MFFFEKSLPTKTSLEVMTRWFVVWRIASALERVHVSVPGEALFSHGAMASRLFISP